MRVSASQSTFPSIRSGCNRLKSLVPRGTVAGKFFNDFAPYPYPESYPGREASLGWGWSGAEAERLGVVMVGAGSG
jgi:hypothetical protein